MISAIFDTETTGLIKPKASEMDVQPYITEIYVLKVEHMPDGTLRRIDDFDQLIKVPIPLSPEITKITGLTDDDLKDKPTFGEIAIPLCKFFVGVDNLVAHNLAFDRSMLANELVRCGKILKFPWPPNHICTVERTMHIEQRRMTLTRLHTELFGCDFPDAHRAKNDVLPLFRCFEKLLEKGMKI